MSQLGQALAMRPTATALILVGCLSIAACNPSAELYEGPKRSDTELAIIENSWSCAVQGCVSEIRNAGQHETIFRGSTYPEPQVGKIHLVPGKYGIYLRYRAYKSSKDFHYGEVNLRAGQTYYVIGEKGGNAFSTSYVWMEDAAGEVLIGDKVCPYSIWRLMGFLESCPEPISN
jgi:hypothetical protein